jgi:ATP-dependent DNA helicase RecG
VILEEILELISKGEGQNLELLKEVPVSEDAKKELAKIMVSFANSGDGVIFVGAEKKSRTIVGLSIDCDLYKAVRAVDKAYCSPSVNPEVSIEKIDNNQLGIVRIRRGSQRPYYVEGDCYVRSGKQVFVASHSELEDMYSKRSLSKKEGSDSWLVEQASWQDLDESKIDEYLNSIGIKVENGQDKLREKVLKDKGIVVEAGQRIIPTAAALLMFGKRPQYFLISSAIRLVKFQGKNIGSVIVDQKEIGGTIPEMIDESWKFLFRHINTGAQVQDLKRIDFMQYPQVALREAITNAIVHKDYSVEGSQARVFMFDDRIEIYTPGGLPQGITVSNMEYTQYSRNKIITEILMHTGKYIEKLGTGIRRIKLVLKQNGLRDPIFFDSGVDFILTLFGSFERLREETKKELAQKVQVAIGDTKKPHELMPLAREEPEQNPASDSKFDFGLFLKSFSGQKKRVIKTMLKAAVAAVFLLAAAIFIVMWRKNIHNPAAQYYKASFLHYKGEYAQAVNAYANFINSFPDNEKVNDATYYMAGCLDILGENIGALNAYADLLKKYPKSRWAPYAHYWRGNIYFDLEEFDNAKTSFQKTFETSPNSQLTLSAMNKAAFCLFKQGKFQEAIDMYDKILDLTEDTKEGYEYYQMGLCYLGLGQKNKARDMFNKVISSKKANPQLIQDAKEQISKLGI